MRIAIVGSGISGLVAAHHLRREHGVTVFEASDWIGGHAHTVDVEVEGVLTAVDTGFVVFDRRTYPTFLGLLEELRVTFQDSDMSFSVSVGDSGVEYAAAQGAPLSLLGRPRNAIGPGFWHMLRDVVRFKGTREGPARARFGRDHARRVPGRGRLQSRVRRVAMASACRCTCCTWTCRSWTRSIGGFGCSRSSARTRSASAAATTWAPPTRTCALPCSIAPSRRPAGARTARYPRARAGLRLQPGQLLLLFRS